MPNVSSEVCVSWCELWLLQSSRGPTWDGRTKPELFLPGEVLSVFSSRNEPSCGTQTMAQLTGTSMSCGLLTGAMALLRQYLRKGFLPSGVQNPHDAYTSPSSSLMRALAVSSAVSNTAFPPNKYGGFGRPRFSTGLHFCNSKFGLRSFSGAVSHDGSQHHSIRAGGYLGVTTSITLAWTDPPGLPMAELALVNNLDLVVKYKGVTYYGGGSYKYSQATRDFKQRDTLNNLEHVLLPGPIDPNEAITITVEGTQVPQGPQNYDIVVKGDIGHPAAGWIQLSSSVGSSMTKLRQVAHELTKALNITTSHPLRLSALSNIQTVQDFRLSELLAVQVIIEPSLELNAVQPQQLMLQLQTLLDGRAGPFGNQSSLLWQGSSQPRYSVCDPDRVPDTALALGTVGEAANTSEISKYVLNWSVVSRAARLSAPALLLTFVLSTSVALLI